MFTICSLALSPTTTNKVRSFSFTPFSTSVRIRESTFFLILFLLFITTCARACEVRYFKSGDKSSSVNEDGGGCFGFFLVFLCVVHTHDRCALFTPFFFTHIPSSSEKKSTQRMHRDRHTFVAFSNPPTPPHPEYLNTKSNNNGEIVEG